jgi:GTP cyclohydrolase I
MQTNKLINSNGNCPLSDEEKLNRIEHATIHYGNFLTALGFDWRNDPNMQDTPMRVSKAFINELLQGCFTEPPKITAFEDASYGYDGIVFQGNIEVCSMCSHHNLAFTGRAHVAYIPSNKVIGLSKLNRIVEWFSRRPQIQEGLTMQIHNYLNEILLDNKGIAVLIEAKHTCASCRGVRHNSTMKTSKLSGAFFTDSACRNEFYHFIETL